MKVERGLFEGFSGSGCRVREGNEGEYNQNTFYTFMKMS